MPSTWRNDSDKSWSKFYLIYRISSALRFYDVMTVFTDSNVISASVRHAWGRSRSNGMTACGPAAASERALAQDCRNVFIIGLMLLTAGRKSSKAQSLFSLYSLTHSICTTLHYLTKNTHCFIYCEFQRRLFNLINFFNIFISPSPKKTENLTEMNDTMLTDLLLTIKHPGFASCFLPCVAAAMVVVRLWGSSRILSTR